jgi:hypothetical protein
MGPVLLTALLPLLLAALAFGQTTATLSGSVTDASQGVLPGATVTAINTETGVETTTVTNNVGVYNFPALQPGMYNVRASKDGFQARTMTDVRLRMASQSNLPFSLEVAGTSTEVEVTATAESMVLEAGASTGTVLQEDLVTELPLVSNDVMDLLNMMGGVVKSEDPIFSNSTQTFAGVASGNINVSRDGISVSEVRYTSGIVSPSRVNQEMVGEFKMILSPVDAEMGRGAGQVQIMTKSGANAFHGSGVWNIQNTALDAEEWYVKRDQGESPWRNLHDYTVSVSGPVIKNRTFFFATWDHQMVREKTQVPVTSLTNCARLGIYRYFSGYNNLGAQALTNPNSVVAPDPSNPGVVPARPVVTSPTDGTPLLNYTGPTLTVNQTMADLKYQSVLGPLSSGAMAAIAADPINCTEYARLYAPSATNPLNGTTGTSWGQMAGYTVPVRNGWDASGYVDQFNPMVPEANYFSLGDGLNIAGYRWTRTTKGANNIFGVGQDSMRKSISVKIDHNINNNHRLSGTYNYDWNTGEDSPPSWDNEYAYGGNITRKPQSFTVSLTSTLKPTLLNEFRFGLSRTWAQIQDPLVANPEGLGELLHNLMPTSNVYPVVVGYDNVGYSPGMSWFTMYAAGFSSGHPYGGMSNMGNSWGGIDHRWTASDTVTWMKGAHSFKGGFEVRLSKSLQNTNGAGAFSAGSMYPSVSGGAGLTSYGQDWNGDGTPDYEFASWSANGMVGSQAINTGGYGTVQNLLNYLSGSVSSITQYFYATPDGDWNRIADGEMRYDLDLRNREFAAFFKDDWKLTNDLTLNLGVRYEYYGVPWEDNGMTVALKGGSASIWGPCGGDFGSNWMPSNPSCTASGVNPAALTQYEFVGPNSPNSNRGAWNKDMNNFAPHVGFSWQLPWLGRGKTTLRGGYSISYSPVNNFDGYAGVMAKVPGTTYQYTVNGQQLGRSFTLNDIKNGEALGILPMATPDVGVTPGIPVLGVQQITSRSQSFSVYDENIRNPYVQNINLSLTRQVGNVLTVDVRYIGTLSRKTLSGINLNQANYINNGLYALFDEARRGGNPAELDAMLTNPMAPFWFGATGADMLRTSPYTQTALMQGNYSAIAGTLATANPYWGAAAGTAGAVLRTAGYAENFIYANPALSSATWTSNLGHSNYHSMQAQVTMRPVRGLSFQTTYTWSRNLSDQGIVDYNNMIRRYYLNSQHRSHTLNSYGTYELPFGANGFLFRNATGAFKKAVEGWSLSWVASLTSGIPGSITGMSRQWGNTDVMLERPDLWDSKAGAVTTDDSGMYGGYFFGDKYVRVVDERQCNMVAASLQALCTGSSGLKALALADPSQADGVAKYTTTYTSASGATYLPGDDVIVFRNPDPGQVGNFGPNELTGPGRWSLDLAMAKSIEFMEGKRLELRIDAQNIFNHPTPSGSSFRWNARFTSIGNPDFALAGSNPNGFGLLSSKGGHRTFQAKIRLSF